ncbi:MAG: hypothetical protein H7X99_05220 [Saprospiraceae bacterium]|nr:hypothetical protein [Saprospiraceae bacterium]
MKYLISLIFITAFCSFTLYVNVYSLSFETIDGTKVELSSFKGKKILIVTLPLSAQDLNLSATELSNLQAKYQNSLIVIGIPAEETGYRKGDDKTLKALYKNQKSNFIISAGMKVKKAAADKQSPLFQWLTNKDRNQHFDQDVRSTGQKFFIDKNGELYAVIGPQLKLNNAIIDRIMTRQ